jgi:pimeloyl-ACP methyl ester carboxylesterase
MILNILQRLLALASLAVLALGGWLVWTWFRREELSQAYEPGFEQDNTRLWLGLALIGWTLVGRFFWRLVLGRGGDVSWARDQEAEVAMVAGADGSQLRVESQGPSEAPVLLFTHGWGLDSSTWRDARRELSARFRVVVWDLPGLGRSRRPADGRYSVDRMAEDLGAVLRATAGGRPVVLVGHSIGGMIVQTFCARHPELLRRRVAGIALFNTTHLNPLKTMVFSGLLRAIQKPILEPAMKLDVWLQPLAWAMNWQAYLSGHTHIAMRFGFGTQPSRALLDHVARLATVNPPAVQAKGNLAMMHWQVTDDLPRLDVPTLVFAGGRDIVTKEEAGRQIAGLIRGARLERPHDAGHLGPQELSRLYNAELAAFADSVLMQPVSSDRAPRAPSRTTGSEAGRSDEAPRPAF